MPGEVADISKTRSLDGRHGRVCGGHKREGGGAHFRGDLSICLVLPALRGVGKGRRKSAGGIAGLRSTDQGPEHETYGRSLKFR